MLEKDGSPLELWGGIECTVNRVGECFHSQLARSGHLEREGDLDRVASLGIRTLRYPLLWEVLAPEASSRIDWTWADARMERLRELGIRPIIGLVHHGSGPRYTSLVDEAFPEKLAVYARAVAERYPWVTLWTPVNEPLTTARFSGLYGHWYPHGRDPHTFCRALISQVQGTALAMRAIREVIPEAQLVQTEDLGEITATPRLQYQADFENERRWLAFDLLTGRLARASMMWEFLRAAGIRESEIERLVEEPCPPGIVGINHYVTSSRYLDDKVHMYPPWLSGGNGRDEYVDSDAVRSRPEGFWEPADLLRKAWERYRLPIAITEVHLGCSRDEQIRWFAEMWKAALGARQSGAEVLAVTAWSLFGAYDWNSLVTQANGFYEPGAFDLRAPAPRPTGLAKFLREVATTGALRSPSLQSAGWWRRRVRRLSSAQLEEEDPRKRLRTIYTPRKSAANAGGTRPILITGATGTLGQAFARICYLRGLPFRLLSRSEMDIADTDAVRSALCAFNPWAVVNAAGYVRVDDAEENRYVCVRENSLGPATLARICSERDIPLLTFSSDLVFDGAKTAAYVESDPTAPLNVYGHSKAAAERLVTAAHPGALLVRTSAFFGPWDEWNFVKQALRALRASRVFKAVDGIRISPTYVPDLVHASLDLLIDGERGTWHLANTGETTWPELARRAARIAELDEQLVQAVPHDRSPGAAARPQYGVLGSERGHLLPCWEDALHRYFFEIRQMAEESPRTEAAMRADCTA